MSSTSPTPDEQHEPSPTPFDETTARRFLELLFGGLTSGFVEFRFVEPGRKRKAAGRPSYLALPLEYDRVVTEVFPRGGTHTIAVGVAPRWHVPERGAAGRGHDVLHDGGRVQKDMNLPRRAGGWLSDPRPPEIHSSRPPPGAHLKRVHRAGGYPPRTVRSRVVEPHGHG